MIYILTILNNLNKILQHFLPFKNVYLKKLLKIHIFIHFFKLLLF